jgi:threonine dehydratase
VANSRIVRADRGASIVTATGSDVMPTIADARAAAERVRPFVHETPLLRSSTLDRVAGRPVYLKGEHLQKTGSYKARGAINHVLTLVEQGSEVGGVVAASSGNHGQAVAWAAGARGLPCTVVGPSSIAGAKRAAIEGYGASLVLVGESSDERLEVAQRLAREEGLYEVPPYDHPRTIAGQATIVLEVAEQLELPDVESVLVAVSGGGLAAGCGLALGEVAPKVSLYGVEPEGADDTCRSLAEGRRVTVEPHTVADALRARRPGRLTFELNQRQLAGVLLVSDAEIVAAARFTWQRLKQVVEYGGAAALAAVLAHRVPGQGPLVVVLSGGNIDFPTGE